MRAKPTLKKVNLKQYTIDELKMNLKLDHSEQLFGFEPELPYQCPRIDSFIADVEMMRDHINRLSNLIDNNENNCNALYISRECNILKEYELVIKETYEEIRKSCESLRRRGEDWKHLARNLFSEVPNNVRFIDDKFKDKIDEYGKEDDTY